jgi:hypothetical protein
MFQPKKPSNTGSRRCTSVKIGYEKDGLRNQTSRSGSATGRLRTTSLSSSANTPVTAPVPSATMAMAHSANIGCRRSERSA